MIESTGLQGAQVEGAQVEGVQVEGVQVEGVQVEGAQVAGGSAIDAASRRDHREGAGSMPWAQARTLAYAVAEPLPASRVPLAGALGSTLVEPLHAANPVPAFTCSAMDGYAVGSAVGPWRVVSRVLAGHIGAERLGPGEAAEIATGAPAPLGAVAVLRYEEVTRSGDTLSGEPAVIGRDVRQAGEDIPVGTELLPAGVPVTPVVIGLAATVGLDSLHVRARPRLAAVLTGDEIVHRGPSGQGRVRDGVGPQLPGLAGCFAADLTSTLLVPDSPPDHLAAALGTASADIIVTCGGVGPGLADPLRAVLDRLRARSFVDGVACRPGHPQRLAQLPDGRWVVGLPGNPFAALVAAFTLLAPLVAGLAGRPLARLPTASLVSDVRARRGTTQLVPVRRLDADRVERLGRDRPGNLWGAALADALAVVPPGWAGQPVGLLVLPG